MIELVFLLILAAMPFVGLLCWLDWAIKRSQSKERRQKQRGFEVKPASGKSPAA